MAIDKFKSGILSLATTIANNEKLLLPFLEKKASDVALQFPYDNTSLAMYNIITRLASNRTTISRAELVDIYNSNYNKNNKFASNFAEELGINSVEETIKLAGEKTVNHIDDQINSFADPILAGSLNQLFGGKEFKGYTEKTASITATETARYLNKLNLTVKSASVVDGNEKFIIVNAEFETPKGQTNILLPVQILNNKPLAPSVFVTNTSVEDVSTETIKDYVLANLGKRVTVRASDVLSAITAKISTAKVISNVELAATKLASSKESTITPGSILEQKLVEFEKDVETPKYSDPEIESFASKFASPVGIASFKFGNDKVILGKNLINKKLASYNIKNSQVTVLDVEDNNVIYAVAADGISFRVPVKLSSQKVLSPEVLIANGSLKSFSQESINELFSVNSFDTRAAAVNSKQYGLKPSELLENIRAAVSERNYAKAEDALNILKDTNDTKAYAIGFNIYANSLSGKEEVKPEVCNKQIKVANSVHAICSHTGLPVHKVYVDKEGNCRPMYRKEMDETYQVASFATKIFL